MLSHSKPDTTHHECSTALTVALAGKRKICSEHIPDMQESLALTFQAIDDCLLESVGHLPRSSPPPCVTLVTGLADGADQIAGRIFLSDSKPTGSKRILGAVLPCPGDEFARNSQWKTAKPLRRRRELRLYHCAARSPAAAGADRTRY